MQGVHLLDNKVYVSNDNNIVKRQCKNGEMAYFQLNKRAMMFDCLILNNDKIVEQYTFHPPVKRMKNLEAIVKAICEHFKPILQDANIDNLIKQLNKRAIL